MNNGWDTNWRATLGGFYEFGYSLFYSSGQMGEREAIDICGAVNSGLVCIRI